ncbi:LOW QUALITY PROTEIN: protein FAM13A [Pholidichthys leucotaenia]
MGAGAMTICHNKTAVQVKEDMKKMVQIPILKPRTVAAKQTKLFGASLSELKEQGLVEEGVPLVVRKMVEHLGKHALHQEGLFRVNGNVCAMKTLKERLERGEDVDLLSESDLYTVASLLKQYLRELPDGLVEFKVQQALIRHYQEKGDDGSWSDMRELLLHLPDVHYSLLRYLCHFLTLVENNHKDNRMTAFNLATVLGPSVFRVTTGFEAMKDQNICNKIMVKFIQNYSDIFESNMNRFKEDCSKEEPSLIFIQVRRRKSGGMVQVLPQPSISAGLPHARPLPIPIVLPLGSELRRSTQGSAETTPEPRQDSPDTGSRIGPLSVDLSVCMEGLSSSQEEDRPISPFYMSNHLSPVHCQPDVVNFLDRTIRSAVEQHLFDQNHLEDQHTESSESTTCPSGPKVTQSARQRRRYHREQQEEGLKLRERNRAASIRASTNKENIPSSSASSAGEDAGGRVDSMGNLCCHDERTPKPRKSHTSPTLVQLKDNQPAHTLKEYAGGRPVEKHMEIFQKENNSPRQDGLPSASQTLRMKIQESPVICDPGRVSGGEVRGSDSDCEKASCNDVPRLDLIALTEDSSWGDSQFFNTPFLDFKRVFFSTCCDEPVPAYSLQRESMDRDEARTSPHGGGRLIRQLLEEDSDPLVSPRFYAFGQSQQYLDDTEVPPSPPNAHSFISRRRSSSLGSCEDEREELTTAQLSRRIHVLKKKIHRFEEKFEEERKYRPSYSDKAANPEVLRWMNELAKLRKQLKEHKLMKSEEDLTPVTRQRSNTLPKSFGSQLEKKPLQEKVSKPPVESTLEGILKKLQEKRDDVNRPEDIKDMTREQIGAEKVALQKALLYYESIHGRPVTKSERQVMKPLYDRYRLVKQILCRASTIPVIGSPSSKRRGPLLQPIIEGETALFFDDIKEEEDGSEDDGDTKTTLTVTVRQDLGVFSFLDHMDEEVDGFISPVDELSPSKNTTDMRLSNLHSATMQELVEQLQEAREEKKRIRKNLKEFEDQFFRQNGRNVQKEDRSPLAVEYNEYKHVKAKLRLLEVLISKRDSTKFI